MHKKNLTIADIAKELNVSTTTVSRVISGKGRIGKTTRERIMKYIDEHNYKPNVIAQGLAKSRTYNIGVVVPEDYSLVDVPFFLNCLVSIHGVAATRGYDILLTVGNNTNMKNLEKIITNRKVDGIILLRTYVEDKAVSYLKENSIPFVVTGSINDDSVVQVDHRHAEGCRELTTILIQKGFQRIALIGGDETHVVSQARLHGFEEAFKDMQVPTDENLIYMNKNNAAAIERAVDEILERNADCIICMDDIICNIVLSKLRKDSIAIPEQIRLACFFNSFVWEDSLSSISYLSFDINKQGSVAGKALIDIIEGKEPGSISLPEYELVLKVSTQRN